MERPKPAKKYLSLEEVEAQLLASQRPTFAQPPIEQPQSQHTPVHPQLPMGPPAPQSVGQQQQYMEEIKPHTQYHRAPPPPQFQQQRQYPVARPPPHHAQFPPPQGQFIAQHSPQRSPVRKLQRPASLPLSQPPPNVQEIMAAENQRLLAEDAKRRKRNQKITEMVLPPALSLCSSLDTRLISFVGQIQWINDTYR